MPLFERLYAGALTAARALSPLASRGSSKLARGLRGRRRAAQNLRDWASAHRRPDRPLVWVHAPSVGEGLQARAVLEALRAARPDVQAVFTHFSPSAEALARAMPVDVAGYLPWDLGFELKPVLDALRPDLVVFTKSEVWPGLSRACQERGVAMALIAGTLAETSSRRGVSARALLGPAYGRLARVLAVSEDDARRLARLGAAEGAIEVTGDPGVDAAAQRAQAADPSAPYLAPFVADRAPTLVAGSTWPADEAVLVPASARVRAAVPGLRMVIAPHEPDDRHVPPLRSALEAAGWKVATLSEVESAGGLAALGARAVIVDRVGVLSHLYTIGSVAYVGGGFGHAGLHSVLEPAAAGLPVAFGPRHFNARDAARLIAAGAARAAVDEDALARTLEGWLAAPGERASAGAAALRYIASHRGAARRSADALTALLSDSPAPNPDDRES